jgi:hypothetical protein
MSILASFSLTTIASSDRICEALSWSIICLIRNAPIRPNARRLRVSWAAGKAAPPLLAFFDPAEVYGPWTSEGSYIYFSVDQNTGDELVRQRFP